MFGACADHKCGCEFFVVSEFADHFFFARVYSCRGALGLVLYVWSDSEYEIFLWLAIQVILANTIYDIHRSHTDRNTIHEIRV